MAEVLLHGFGISGFRSLDYGEPQRVGPMSGVHLVVGSNNAGKSNVLRAAERLVAVRHLNSALSLEHLDQPVGSSNRGASQTPLISIAVRLDLAAVTAALRSADHVHLAEAFVRVLERSGLVDPAGFCWPELAPETLQSGVTTTWKLTNQPVAGLVKGLADDDYNRQRMAAQFASGFGRAGGIAGIEQNVMQAYAGIVGSALPTPPVRSIPPFRQIAEPNAYSESSFVGDGLYRRLGALQHPPHEAYRDGITRFAAVNSFVQDLLEDDGARLEVTHDAQNLLLHHRGRILPLDSYGTGIHQTIILAAAASVLDGTLVCIEEPEIHLHPTMQRKLLAYLSANTSNQYLIATHSAAMLDAARASISAVRLTDGFSVVSPAVEPEHVAQLSADLGYRASDLVQSNAVVWVEGPSDRTYIRFWLRQMAPDLEEGKHYSLMFYGGALLKHLAPTDPSVEEFISLPRLNRNFAVVIDSDKEGPRKHINPTKKRVQGAIADASGNAVAWVTNAYTIENYVPADLLCDAVKSVHPTTSCLWHGDPWTNPLGEKQLSGTRTYADKNKVASRVVGLWAEQGPALDDWPLDLAERITDVITLIRRANE